MKYKIILERGKLDGDYWNGANARYFFSHTVPHVGDQVGYRSDHTWINCLITGREFVADMRSETAYREVQIVRLSYQVLNEYR